MFWRFVSRVSVYTMDRVLPNILVSQSHISNWKERRGSVFFPLEVLMSGTKTFYPISSILSCLFLSFLSLKFLFFILYPHILLSFFFAATSISSIHSSASGIVISFFPPFIFSHISSFLLVYFVTYEPSQLKRNIIWYKTLVKNLSLNTSCITGLER